MLDRSEREAQQASPGVAYITRSMLEEACGESARFLKAYQLTGINFLMLLNSQGLQGCILADEMGLGKVRACMLVCVRMCVCVRASVTEHNLCTGSGA